MNRWKLVFGRSVASASLIGALASGCSPGEDGGKAIPSSIVEHTESALTTNSWTYKGGNGVVIVPGSSPTVFSGVVSDIDYVPAAGIYRLGTAAGGVVQYVGPNWSPISDSIASTDSPPQSASGVSIGAEATHPTNSAIILAGTGSVAYKKPQIGGSGIWRTTNSGSTWTNVLSSSTTGNRVYRIAWSTHTIGMVWAGTTKGLFRSMDSGATWTQLVSGRVVTDIVHKADDSVLMIGIGDSIGSGVFRSLNQGTGFANIFFLPGGTVSAVNLATDSTGTTVYAQWGSVGQMQLKKSTDSGLTFPTTLPSPSDGNCGDSGFMQAIGVSPDGQTVVTGCAQINRSTNGGASWTPINTIEHGGYHVIKFVSSTTVVLGSNTGWHYSNDAGVTWGSATNNIPISDLTDFDARIDAPTVYYGGSAYGAFVSPDGGASWHGFPKPTNGYLNMFVTVDPAAGSQRAWGADGGGNCYATADQGTTWTSINHGLGGCYNIQNDQVPGVFLYTAASAPGNPSFYGIYRSTDGGSSWNLYPTSSMPSLPTFPYPFATGRYGGSSVIYANVSTDSAHPKFIVLDPNFSGTTWRDVTSQLTTPAVSTPNIMMFATSLTSPSVAFAFAFNDVWRTANSGATWSFVGATTPIPSSAYITDLLEDPLNTNIWIATTTLGIFKTSDGGVNWRSWKSGLPQGNPYSSKLHGQVTGSPSTFQVFGGLNGRGIFQRDAAGDDP